MKCQNCGTEIQGQPKFCPRCGSRVEYNAYNAAPVRFAGVNSPMPAASTFADKPAKKMSKGRKAKIIVISVLILIIALVVTLAALFFTSSAYSVYGNMKSANFENALSDYHSDVEDNFIQEKLLKMLLKKRVDKAANEFKDGKITYDSAAAELNTLYEMGFDAAKSKIDEITVTNEAFEALEKADKYYASGDYENSISEYSKIPKTDENYSEAQTKLNEIYPKYISSVADTASDYNSQGKYKEAVNYINVAFDILPENADTASLNKIKNESLTLYKTDVSDKVTGLISESKFTEAFDIIDEAIAFDEDESFKKLKITAEKGYVEFVIGQANKYTSKKDYAGAKALLDTALKELPDNTELNDKLKEIEDNAPTPLSSLTPINIGNNWNSSLIPEWNAGSPIDPFGNNYVSSINYLIFSGGSNDYVTEHYAEYKINKEYTTISGSLISHADIPETGYGLVRIYADNKLIFTSPQIGRKSDLFNFSVNISGADWVKIVVVADKSFEVGAHNTPRNCLMIVDAQLWH